MQDRVPRLPGRRRVFPENGMEPFYATIEREDDPLEVGTPQNTATHFTAATAALFGLTGNAAIPNNALNMLGARATCATAAATAAKAAVQSGFTRATGSVVRVIFTYTNTAAAPTLNVNNTGAATIRYANEALGSPGMIVAGLPHLFMFDGTYWQLLNPNASAFIVSGTYTGDGVESRTISLGFQPKAVFVSGLGYLTNIHSHMSTGLALPGSPASVKVSTTIEPIISITTAGFIIYFSQGYIQTNQAGMQYNYIAWR